MKEKVLVEKEKVKDVSKVLKAIKKDRELTDYEKGYIAGLLRAKPEEIKK